MARLNVPLSAIPNTQVRRAVAEYKGGDSVTGETHDTVHKRKRLNLSGSPRFSTPLRTQGSKRFKSPKLNTTDWVDFWFLFVFSLFSPVWYYLFRSINLWKMSYTLCYMNVILDFLMFFISMLLYLMYSLKMFTFYAAVLNFCACMHAIIMSHWHKCCFSTFYMLLQYKLELKTNAQICVLHLFYLKIYIFLLNTCKIIYDTQLMLQE